ncbi:MAG: SRPBCC family protein [Nocardioidaceae bacterium]
MASVTTQRRIAAPVERVWAVATDIPGSAETITGINHVEMLSEGDFGVGTRWRETRTMLGREATEEMWVTSVDPVRSYTVEAESHGMHYVSTFRFLPVDESQTEVVLVFSGEPQGTGARLVAAVTGPLAKRSVAKALRSDLDDLAETAERR